LVEFGVARKPSKKLSTAALAVKNYEKAQTLKKQ
jgi:hypothetical protein